MISAQSPETFIEAAMAADEARRVEHLAHALERMTIQAQTALAQLSAGSAGVHWQALGFHHPPSPSEVLSPELDCSGGESEAESEGEPGGEGEGEGEGEAAGQGNAILLQYGLGRLEQLARSEGFHDIAAVLHGCAAHLGGQLIGQAFDVGMPMAEDAGGQAPGSAQGDAAAGQAKEAPTETPAGAPKPASKKRQS